MSNIHVSCRVRPQNALEKKQGGLECVATPDGKSLEVNPEDGFSTDYLRCTFDQVFAPTATQRQVYEATAKSLVVDLLDGYNCTVFAYGQTGSGKTHTVLGPKEGVGSKPDEQGLIARLVHDIFESVQMLSSETVYFELSGSFLEIYMEQIRDLLQPNFIKKNLRIRENGPRGIYVDDLTHVPATSEEVMLQLVERGNTNRVVACTRMNNDSSRSHTILMINMTRRDVLTGTEKKATMYVVDLAGSEMVAKTMASGKTLNEARAINKSLSALSNVIKALVEGKKHIPFISFSTLHRLHRDSKLTRLLQDSLGGHAKTCLIVTISASSYNVAETISTVRFGMRAKEIKNEPLLHETQSMGVVEYQQMYQALLAENAELQATLQQVQAEKETLLVKCEGLEREELELEPEEHEHSISTDSQTYCISLVDVGSQTAPVDAPSSSSNSLMQAFSSFLFVDNQSQRHHRTQSVDAVQSQLAAAMDKVAQLTEDLRLCRSENEALKDVHVILSEQNRTFNTRAAEFEASITALHEINSSISAQNTVLSERNKELEAKAEAQMQSLASQMEPVLASPDDQTVVSESPQKHMEMLSRKLVEMKLHAHYVTEYAKAVLDHEKYEVVCQMTQLRLQNEQFRYNEHQNEVHVKELEAKCVALKETIQKSEEHASSVERSVQEYQSLYKEQVRLSHEKQQHLLKEVDYYKMIWHRVSKPTPEPSNNAATKVSPSSSPPTASLALALETIEPTLHRPASFSGAVPSEPLSLMALKRSSRTIVKPLSPSPRTLLSPRTPRPSLEVKDDENDPLSIVFTQH